MTTRKLLLVIGAAAIVFDIAALSLWRLIQGPGGRLTVTIENHTLQPLRRGRYTLNGHDKASWVLAPPFRTIAPGATVTGTFEDWSGCDVGFVYDVGPRDSCAVYCGYPDDGMSLRTLIVAEGDTMVTKSVDPVHSRDESP